jgi:SAM-dependent methyltransferase
MRAIEPADIVRPDGSVDPSRLSGSGAIVRISPERTYKVDREKNKGHYERYFNLPIDLDAIARSGANYKKLFSELDLLDRGNFLEIGCGTGRGTFPFVHSFNFDHYLITDGMGEFVEVAKANIARVRETAPADYGVMTAEDIERFPKNHFSVVALFACLHHVNDWRGFIATAGARLAPGGVILMVEPTVEFQIHAGALLSGFLERAHLHGLELSEEQRNFVSRRISAFTFLSARNVDKTGAEDKWSFRIDEVMRAGIDAGLVAHTFPGGDVNGPKASPRLFSNVLRNRLVQLRGGGDIAEGVLGVCAPEIAYLDNLARSGVGPYFSCLYAFRRP